MAIIYQIEDYRDKTKKRDPLEEAKKDLRNLLEPLGAWESKEEKIRFFVQKAEKDMVEGII